MSIQQALIIHQVEQVIISHTQQTIETGKTNAPREAHGGILDFPFVVIVVIFMHCCQRDGDIHTPLTV